MHIHVHDARLAESDKSIRKLLRKVGRDWNLLVAHGLCDVLGRKDKDFEHIDKTEKFVNRIESLIIKQSMQTVISRPISGYDLIEIGVKKGPEVGRLLRCLDDELDANPNLTREEAISFVQGLV